MVGVRFYSVFLLLIAKKRNLIVDTDIAIIIWIDC